MTYDYDAGTAIASTTIPVAEAVYDSLQTDARWTYDSTGYNLELALAGTSWAVGDTLVRVEAKIQPVAGQAFACLWDVDVIPVLTS